MLLSSRSSSQSLRDHHRHPQSPKPVVEARPPWSIEAHWVSSPKEKLHNPSTPPANSCNSNSLSQCGQIQLFVEDASSQVLKHRTQEVDFSFSPKSENARLEWSQYVAIGSTCPDVRWPCCPHWDHLAEHCQHTPTTSSVGQTQIDAYPKLQKQLVSKGFLRWKHGKLQKSESSNRRKSPQGEGPAIVVCPRSCIVQYSSICRAFQL